MLSAYRGLIFDHPDTLIIEDNCLDVMPNDPQTVKVSGQANGRLTYRYYMGEERMTAS
jgi:hypothetical protein